MLRKLILAILITTLLIGTASAATLYVGSTAKYKTIQSAVNAASDGDTIKVASGTYNEYVSISGKFINVYGTSYPKMNGFRITQGGERLSTDSISRRTGSISRVQAIIILSVIIISITVVLASQG